MKWRKSLAGRLYAAALLWMVVAVAIGGLVLAQAFRGSVERGFELRLDAMMHDIIAGLEVDPTGAVLVTPRLAEPRFQRPYSGLYWQIRDRAGLIARSRSLWDATLASNGELVGAAQTYQTNGPRGEALLVLERRVTFAGRPAPVHVLVAGDRTDVDRELTGFYILLALALGGLGLGLLLAVALQVHYGMRPLRALAADLDRLRVAGGRLTGDYPQEIRPLIEATNRVLDHDEAMIAHARAHMGNLAHALKTPLAVIKSEHDAGPRNSAVNTQLHRMGRLIEYHLARARAVAAAPFPVERSPLAPITAELVDTMAKIFIEKELTFDQSIPPDVTAAVDREEMMEMLGNLLENAGKYAQTTVRIRASRQGGTVQVTVEDDGPGLDKAQTRQIARRGARLDESMPGWGLGLSIVSDLVDLHGGGLEFTPSEMGGLAVILILPPGTD